MKDPKEIKAGDLVEVIWTDAMQEAAWTEANETNLRDVLVACYGLFVGRDEKFIRMCMGVGPDGTTGSMLGLFSIPIGMIQQIKRIRVNPSKALNKILKQLKQGEIELL